MCQQPQEKGMVKRSATVEVDPAPSGVRRVWKTAGGCHSRLPWAILADAANRDRTIASLVSDISTALGEAVDELSTYSSEFRIALQRGLLHLLRRGEDRSEPVLFFNEAVPGFTVLLFKKRHPSPDGIIPDSIIVPSPDFQSQDSSVHSANGLRLAAPPCDSPEAAAAAEVVRQFVQRTGATVLVTEGTDALFAFFPVADVRKNLREMGFYLTD